MLNKNTSTTYYTSTGIESRGEIGLAEIERWVGSYADESALARLDTAISIGGERIAFDKAVTEKLDAQRRLAKHLKRVS